MKLLKLRANKNTFKTVFFRDGFNFIVAEKSDNSGDKDSTNGLGKSLLLEIVDFCLGAGASETLKKDEMKEWKFFLDVDIDGDEFTLARNVDDTNSITVLGEVDKLGLPVSLDGKYTLDIVKNVLGKKLFGLNDYSIETKKNKPTYRSLISYFMRTGPTGYTEPFAYFSKQPAWSKQVNNAYLLGLDWELATKMSQLKVKLDSLEKANKAIDDGAMNDLGGTVGELESEKINTESKLEIKIERLKNFQVYEDYREIQDEANNLTDKIHVLLNSVTINSQVIEKYKADLDDEKGESLRVQQIYKDAGVIFSDILSKTLDEVESFHSDIVANRKNYLKQEIDQITKENDKLQSNIADLTNERSKYMSILDSHGALDEYAMLQSEVNREYANIADLDSRIKRLTEIEELISSLRVDIERMVNKMRRDYSERLPTIASAIKIFNANSEYLYAQPGTLSIDTTKDGYRFKVEIKRSGSDGVGNMKIFCYDLMLAEYWSEIMKREVPLFHDSKIFADVDPRQVAKSLELAKSKSENLGFQYICSMNSSYIPYDYLSSEFKDTIQEFKIVTFNDKEDSGTLLGVTF